MASCVCCGRSLPDNQGSSTCSMCYGDPDHGQDGYMRDAMERSAEQAAEGQYREQEGPWE
jgi:hypothetical protein